MPVPSPTPRISQYLLHYTSREGAQNIIASGRLAPGPSGQLYFTDDLYLFGVDAAERLSIIRKPVELAVLVSWNDLPREELRDPRPAEPLQGPDGDYIRPGGGSEYYLSRPVPISREMESWLVLQVP